MDERVVEQPCRRGCVSLLMQMGGDGATCTANDEGYSALALASSLGHREVVRVMIEVGGRFRSMNSSS